MAWDVLSGATKMAWDVLSGVTKTALDVLSGVANPCGMFCPGWQKMAWDVLWRDVLSYILIIRAWNRESLNAPVQLSSRARRLVSGLNRYSFPSFMSASRKCDGETVPMHRLFSVYTARL